jgi:hypothetical protein
MLKYEDKKYNLRKYGDVQKQQILVVYTNKLRAYYTRQIFRTIYFRTLSKSKLLYDWRSVRMYSCRVHSGTCDQILLPVETLPSESCSLVSVGCPLWREVVSVTIGTGSRSWIYFTTDGRSVGQSLGRSVSQYVCLGVEPTLELVTRYYPCRNIAVWKLRSCFCGAPSLTRGRACNLQCNHSMFRVALNP